MPPVILFIASRWSATDELTEQDLEANGRSIIEVLYQNVIVVSEENYDIPQPRLLIIRPRFELGTSQTQIYRAKLYQ
jgi:hypothetical protein